MAALNLRSLIDKLNTVCRKTLEEAAALCVSRTNYNVEIEHWLLKILEAGNTDLDAIIHHHGIDGSRVSQSLMTTLDGLKTGNARSPSLSPQIVDLIREAWLLGSVEFNSPRIRTGHLICAALGDDTLRRQIIDSVNYFDEIPFEQLMKELPNIIAETSEAAEASAGAALASVPDGDGVASGEALVKFTIDLTERARAGDLDPVIGRHAEVRQIIDILTRRRQNNPILTGEAGVGKTAVVEGFALRVASGDVPLPLKDASVRVLDLGLLQAGAGIRGEFENRLKSVIEEVKASASPIILFIDEAHTMIGAGGEAGQGDAANLLKPALARGELRTIAATTWAEYKKYFEKDAALTRRFQVIKVEEPSEDVAIEMMRGLVDPLENHHGVRIINEGLESAVKLSSRYVSGRQLPDKSVSVLDTSCARIALSQSSIPPLVEDCQRKIATLNTTLGLLRRESATGLDHADAIKNTEDELHLAQDRLADLTKSWEKQKELVERIHELEASLEEPEPSPESQAEQVSLPQEQTIESASNNEETAVDREAAQRELDVKKKELLHEQGETPLVHLCVDSQAIAETISSWTGIPLGRMVADEIQTVLDLKQLMQKYIIGQSHALSSIAERVRISRAQLGDPRQPIGVFLLAGPSGVGKTETAITLAELLYGGEQNMTVINMSEFKEEHKVSLLMGSPPGYVGYGEGGVLTEAVRRKPYSVVLLDEMEKAHPGVQDIFYQVFDKGTMKDGEGRDIDFRNTVLIMTTNEGTDRIKSLCADPETRPDAEALTKTIFDVLLEKFKPAFLGRTTIIPYYMLSDEELRKIVDLKLNKIGKRVLENHRATLEYSDELASRIAERCTEVDTGARNIDHILNHTLLPQLANEFLKVMAEGKAISGIEVGSREDGTFFYSFS